MDTDTSLEAALARITEYEAGLQTGGLTARALRKVGPTRAFAEFYRRFGPKVDPWLFRKTGGRIATKVFGMPALLLITTGAKSGKRRESPLLYARDGRDFVIVGTNFGTHNHPAWTANLAKHPDAEIVVGVDTLAVRASLVDEETFRALWPRLVAIYGGYESYLERLKHRKPRMFRLTPVSR